MELTGFCTSPLAIDSVMLVSYLFNFSDSFLYKTTWIWSCSVCNIFHRQYPLLYLCHYQGAFWEGGSLGRWFILGIFVFLSGKSVGFLSYERSYIWRQDVYTLKTIHR